MTYFVDESNKAHYQSEISGKMLAYLTANPRRVQIRERNGKRSFAIADVTNAETAVAILSEIIARPRSMMVNRCPPDIFHP